MHKWRTVFNYLRKEPCFNEEKLTLVVFMSHLTNVTWCAGISLSSTEEVVCECGCDVPCDSDFCHAIWILGWLVRRRRPAGVEMYASVLQVMSGQVEDFPLPGLRQSLKSKSSYCVS